MSDDLDDVVWADPPEHAIFGGHAGRYRKFAEQLRAHRGRWAVLPGDKATEESARGTAGNIRNGKVNGFAPKGAFEAAVDGKKVFVRYVGPEADELEAGAQASSGEASVPPQPSQNGDVGEAPAARDWARRNGYQVPERGRLSAAVINAYRESEARRVTEQ